MLTGLTVLLALSAAGGSAPSPDTIVTRTLDSAPLLSSDSVPATAGPTLDLARVALGPSMRPKSRSTLPLDSTAQRRRAVEHSDWYYRRLAIHKAASYATAPLFVAEYIVGEKLFDDDDSSGNLKSTHQALATGIGVLFGVNTVTGAWNLWDSRHETQGRARRFTHAALMLAADAGFVATASLAPEGEDEGEREDSNDRSRHRTVAITSMGVSLASYLMMYLWK